MRKILFFVTISMLQSTKAQVSVYDCNMYTNHLTQSEINVSQDHFGSCIMLGGNQNVIITGSDNKSIYAAEQIHIDENFHAGAFDATGQLHLKISERSDIDIAVMNYTGLHSIQRYKKFEIGVKLPTDVLERVNHFLLNEGAYQNELNPFLEWDIDVEATFYHAASETYKKIDGYYHREYIENEDTDDWDDIGTDYPFRIRYAPPKNGKWIASVVIKINNQLVYESNWFNFMVVESGDPGYVYVHPNKKNLMRGDRMIYPVGHNFPSPMDHSIQWGGGGDTSYLGNNLFQNSYPTKAANTLEWDSYYNMVEAYFQQGGKFIRTIQTPWSSLVEYEKKGNYYDRLHYAWEQDKFMDLCESYDALVQFNLLMHTPFTIVDGYNMHAFDWERYRFNPSGNAIVYDINDDYPVYCYNDNPQQTGGKMPHEALENEDDLKYHEQRTRYYIARYGYSTKIYEFELLSEPFNVNTHALTNAQPYYKPLNADSSDQTELFNAIYTYHGRIGHYIKEVMDHKHHLLGVDYGMGIWNPTTNLIRMDKSYEHGTIDIIGMNDYSYLPNKYIVRKIGNNNEFSGENSKARAIRTFQLLANKPILISECGSGDDVAECSNNIGDYVDAMAMGFVGASGFNLWNGLSTTDSILWPTTIRAQYHMNGDDVINTLSDGYGAWIQGRQHAKLTNNNNHEFAVEHQYYISNNKELVVGYVRNRTYNVMTKGDFSEKCILNWSYPFNTPLTIFWTNPPSNDRLRIEGLKNNTDYRIEWYSYKEGNYMGDECRNSQADGDFKLNHPPLLVSIQNSLFDQPVLWYVIKQNNCQQGIMTEEDETEMVFLTEDTGLDEVRKDDLIIYLDGNLTNSNVYPNPFDDYFVVNSEKEDLLIMQNIDGSIVGTYNIEVGTTKITTLHLVRGVYIISLQSQSKQFKFEKR